MFEIKDIPAEAVLRAPDSQVVEAVRDELGCRGIFPPDEQERLGDRPRRRTEPTGRPPNVGLSGRRVVVYTGNFDLRQGTELLVEAMPAVTARCPEALLLLVGGEPEQVERIQRLAAARRVSAAVRATIGKRSIEQMPELMALADVLVSPRVEPLVTPLKIYAYMASGRPIVATDLPTYTEVLDTSSGLLVAPPPAGVADGILTILADPALGQRLGQQARAAVETRHSYARFKEQLDALYAFVLQTRSGRVGSPDDVLHMTSASRSGGY